MPRTKLRQGQTQTSKEEGGSTARTTAQIEKYYSGGKREFTYKKNDRGKVIKVELKGGGMSVGQAKLAAKAPPPNKIDAKDFAVLRAEKAKGRGMGLQDESVKPGKVMKAKRGKMFDGYLSTFDASAEASTPKAQRGVTTIVGVRPGAKIGKGKKKFKSMEAMRTAKGFRTIDGKQETSSEFNKRRMALAAAKKSASASRIGKIALGIGAAGVAAQQYLKSKMNKKKDVKKKMGGGMMQKPMGYKYGTEVGKGPLGRAAGRAGRAAGLGVLGAAAAGKYKHEPHNMSFPGDFKNFSESSQLKEAREKADSKYEKDKQHPVKGKHASFDRLVNSGKVEQSAFKKYRKDTASNRESGRKMGGMMKPSGYRTGTMVKARGCKLGRNKPTKIT